MGKWWNDSCQNVRPFSERKPISKSGSINPLSFSAHSVIPWDKLPHWRHVNYTKTQLSAAYAGKAIWRMPMTMNAWMHTNAQAYVTVPTHVWTVETRVTTAATCCAQCHDMWRRTIFLFFLPFIYHVYFYSRSHDWRSSFSHMTHLESYITFSRDSSFHDSCRLSLTHSDS